MGACIYLNWWTNFYQHSVSESLNAAPMHLFVEVVDQDHNYSNSHPLQKLWFNYLSKKVHLFLSSKLHQNFRNFLHRCFFLSFHSSSSPSCKISTLTRDKELLFKETRNKHSLYQECLQAPKNAPFITQLRPAHPLL